MELPKLVGIAGTNGAGKDELGVLLRKLRHYHFVSASDILRAELTRRNVPLERENLSKLSREWRVESGDEGILVVKALEQYKAEKQEHDYAGLAIGSVRHPEEAARIQKYGGKVVWVDAPQRLRYERIQKGERDRTEDQKTFEQFQEEEAREMNPTPNTPGSLNMQAVREMANIVIKNDFSSVKEYRAHLRDEFKLNES